jgi:hypothetical protein
MTDHETERARLTRIYSKMTDEELGMILADEKSLTDIAKGVLEAELALRPINPGQPAQAAAEQLREREFATDEPGARYSGPLVMVKRFRDLPEAVVAKSILDSAEIDSFLADENIVRMDWLYSNLVGGAKLMVRPEDLDEAIDLLSEANRIGGEGSAAGSPDPTGEQSE